MLWNSGRLRRYDAATFGICRGNVVRAPVVGSFEAEDVGDDIGLLVALQHDVRHRAM
jgi:hypothetical protein